MSGAAGGARSFAAMRHAGYRAHFTTFVLAMMADNIEHVISYWMMYRKFHSPALGGFAVVSHWLPFLLLSVPAGALADRFDPRRLVQIGMAMFITASLGWAWFFATDSLQMWEAMALLTLHGCAGVLWQPSSQLLLHDIVPPPELPSAVRMNATGRNLGVLVGPAVGGALLLGLGPVHGMFVNTVFYLPLVLWLWKAPYGPRFRRGAPAPVRAVRGLRDIPHTWREIAHERVIVSMVLLAGAASFFIGHSYQAQMPGFAMDLGHGDPGVAYSMLLGADACGALAAGFLLEGSGWMRTEPRSALWLAMAWAAALGGFALAPGYAAALALLFLAGFLELSFSSMAQALVQLHAPAAARGRVIGLYNMSAMGLRAFSGITVGLAGTWIGIHHSLALAALGFLGVAGGLLLRSVLARRGAG
jgi:MFS family permease